MSSSTSRKSIIKQFLCVCLFLFCFSTLGVTQDNTGELPSMESAEVSGVIGTEGDRLELEDGTYVEFLSGTFTTDTAITVSTSVTKPELVKIVDRLVAETASKEELQILQIIEEKTVEITRYTIIDVSAIGIPNDKELLEELYFNVHLPVVRPYEYHNIGMATTYFFSDEDYIGLAGRQYRNTHPTDKSVSRLLDVRLGDAVTLNPPQDKMSVVIIVKGFKNPPPPRDVERERNGG